MLCCTTFDPGFRQHREAHLPNIAMRGAMSADDQSPKSTHPDQVLSGVRDEDRGASGQKQGWCIRRKAEGPKTETADFIGALKSPFLSVVHGVSRPHHW